MTFGGYDAYHTTDLYLTNDYDAPVLKEGIDVLMWEKYTLGSFLLCVNNVLEEICPVAEEDENQILYSIIKVCVRKRGKMEIFP